jgi:hypothetical protein
MSAPAGEKELMIESNQMSKHWEDLAEQLGLDPENSAEMPKTSHEPAEDIAPPVEGYEVENEPAPEPVAEEETSTAQWRRDPAPVEDETPTIEEIPAEPKMTGADRRVTESDDERGPKRRSGRRRGRRSRSSEAPATEKNAETPTEEAGAEKKDDDAESVDAASDRSRPRGRGRRRGGDKPIRREEAAADEPTAKEPVVNDGEDNDLDDLSNWQAPSWQELIGSLYRPER